MMKQIRTIAVFLIVVGLLLPITASLAENAEEAENAESIENAEEIENAEDIESVESVAENVESIAENAEDIENAEHQLPIEESLAEDAQDIEDAEDIGYQPMFIAPMSIEMSALSLATEKWDWVVRTSPGTGQWRSHAYGNGVHVAVASGGSPLVTTSTDGVTWTGRASPTNEWRSVAFGNGIFVAVGLGGSANQRAMTSPDGINWTVRGTPGDSAWFGVTYGNGLFVAVARRTYTSASNGRGQIMTSPDGVNWTLRNAPNGNAWRRITFGNGMFVAVAGSENAGNTRRIMTSPDGINWTAQTTPATDFNDVAYGNGVFIATAGSNGIYYSTNGATWQNAYSAGGSSWQGVTFGEGIFVVVGQGTAAGLLQRTARSRDGVNWEYVPASISHTWDQVGYGGGMFVALANAGAEDTRIMTTPHPDITFDDHTITIRKTNSANDGLNGAQFQITGNGQNVILTTSGNGEAIRSLAGFEAGTYTITEIVPPAGYSLSAASQTFTLNVNGTVSPANLTFSFSNQPHTMQIRKTTEGGAGLAGAVFNISGNGRNVNVATGADGAVTQNLAGWANGTYTITEITPPAGYKLSSAPQTFTLNINGTVSPANLTFSFSNQPHTMQIRKTTEGGAGLAGAVFNISGNGRNVNVTTGADGTVTRNLAGWANGTYTITEITPPAGYKLSSAPQTFTINGGSITPSSASRTFRNEPNEIGIVTIEKGDESEEPLPGAKYSIIREDEGEWELIVDAEDGTYWQDLGGWRNGRYRVRQIVPPNGYTLDDEERTFEIVGDGTISEEVLVFEVEPLIVEVINIDSETKDYLDGATFRVTKKAEDGAGDGGESGEGDSGDGDSSGNGEGDPGGEGSGDDSGDGDNESDAPPKSWELIVKVENGMFDINLAGMENGTYIVEQLIPPAGYKLNEIPQEFTMPGDGTLDKHQLIFENDPLEINIAKLCIESGEQLPGAVFSITRISEENYDAAADDGEALREVYEENWEEIVAVEEGSITVKLSGWENGTYMVEEIVPPEGYHNDSTAQFFEIKDGGISKTELMFENHKIEEVLAEEAVTEEAVTEEAVTEEALTEEALAEEAVTGEVLTAINDSSENAPPTERAGARRSTDVPQTGYEGNAWWIAPLSLVLVSGMILTATRLKKTYKSKN